MRENESTQISLELKLHEKKIHANKVYKLGTLDQMKFFITFSYQSHGFDFYYLHIYSKSSIIRLIWNEIMGVSFCIPYVYIMSIIYMIGSLRRAKLWPRKNPGVEKVLSKTIHPVTAFLRFCDE